MPELVHEAQGKDSYDYFLIGKYIVAALGVCGGRPTFKGTRVEVQTVLDWLCHGLSVGQILEAYPRLSKAAVEEAVQLASRAFREQHALRAA